MKTDAVLDKPEKEKQELPPGPKGLWTGLKALDPRKDSTQFFLSLVRDYGDIARLRVARRNIFFLNHPDYVREVLVNQVHKFKKGHMFEMMKLLLGEGLITSDGKHHRRQRRIMQPSFHRQQINTFAGCMCQAALDECREWSDGATRNINLDMMHLALKTLAKALFGEDVDRYVKTITDAMTTGNEFFAGWAFLPFPNLLLKLPVPVVQRFRRSRDRLDAVIYEMIDQRRKNKSASEDLISKLVAAQDDEGDGGGMTDVQLRDELVTLVLAGHETSANAMTWMWYALSQHPEVEAKLHAEIDSVLGGRLPTAEDLPNLTYSNHIVAESMRLYPPVYILGRRVVKDAKIGDYVLPAGNNVIISQFTTHRDPRFWSNPEKFDPDRWATDEVKNRHRFSYFPFGGGPRQCIGEQFAWLESQLSLIVIAQRWRLRLDPDQKIAMAPSVTLRPKFGMNMITQARS